MTNKQSGAGWVGAALGAGTGLLGMIGQGRREERQMKNQERLMGIQAGHQERLNRQGADLQYEMWEKTNYPAQMAMLKKAGLNAGLLYGQSGTGGATTGSQGGGSAQGGSAPNMMPMELGSMIAASKAGAEVELMKAQAEKLKAETKKTAGVDTEEAKTRIDNMLVGMDTERSKQAMNGAITYLKQIEGYVAEGSKEDAIDRIHWLTERAVADASKANSEAYVAKGTREEQKKIIASTAAKSILEIELTDAQIGKTKEEAREITNRILQAWGMLKVAETNAISNTVQAGAADRNATTNQGNLALRGQELNFDYMKLEVEKVLKEIGLAQDQQKIIIGALGDVLQTIRLVR